MAARSKLGIAQTEYLRRLRAAYGDQVGEDEQVLLLAWSAFTATFAATRAITHWIRAGHGPASGGMSLGGRHFHHYNIGIALLAGVGALVLRGERRHHKHPVTATAYGAANALIMDEMMLLLDLKDVYWTKDGRRSVDAAVAVIGLGGVYLAAVPFWQRAARELSNVLSESTSGEGRQRLGQAGVRAGAVGSRRGRRRVPS
jgi:hypothetical protein